MLSTMAQGMLKTGAIFVLTLALSLPLGMIVALCRKSKIRIDALAHEAYIFP